MISGRFRFNVKYFSSFHVFGLRIKILDSNLNSQFALDDLKLISDFIQYKYCINFLQFEIKVWIGSLNDDFDSTLIYRTYTRKNPCKRRFERLNVNKNRIMKE